MRRTFLGWLAAGAGAAALPRAALAAPDRFDALSRPALRSAKAAQATMLAITRAGDRLVAVGERGIVLLSDDDAATWRQANVPVSVALTAARFVDARRGWAVGHLGVVLGTTDGGEHWSLQLDGQRGAELALQSADGDAKARTAAQAFVDDGPDKPLLDVFFTSERTGYAIGAYGLAFRTDDGGAHWQAWIPHLPNPKGLHLYAMCANGGALYIAGEQGLLLRSTDGGQQFAPLVSPSKGTFFGAVSGGEGELMLHGLRGRAFRSSDAAQSWTEIDTATRASLSAGARLADGSWLLASQGGELMRSRDGGHSFQPVAAGPVSSVNALTQTARGRLALATLRGVQRVDLAATS
jgi:photosystem II stability/assembly factor-like uncharacterized protein